MDDADKVTELDSVIKESQIFTSQQRIDVGAKATGYCLYDDCGEPLQEGQRWCGVQCRDAWSIHLAQVNRRKK